MGKKSMDIRTLLIKHGQACELGVEAALRRGQTLRQLWRSCEMYEKLSAVRALVFAEGYTLAECDELNAKLRKIMSSWCRSQWEDTAQCEADDYYGGKVSPRLLLKVAMDHVDCAYSDKRGMLK